MCIVVHVASGTEVGWVCCLGIHGSAYLCTIRNGAINRRPVLIHGPRYKNLRIRHGDVASSPYRLEGTVNRYDPRRLIRQNQNQGRKQVLLVLRA